MSHVANLPLALVNTPVNALPGAFVGLAAAVVPLQQAGFLNKARHHRYVSLPTCRLISANMNSYSHNQKTKKNQKSKTRRTQNHRKYYLFFYA